MFLLSETRSKIKLLGFLSVAIALNSCASSQVSTAKDSCPQPLKVAKEKEVLVETKPKQEVENTADFGEWNPTQEAKDCRQNQRIIFDSKLLVECLNSLDETEGRIFLRNAFWADTLWIKSLESRRAAFLHLQKNRRQQEARDLLDQLLNTHALIDPYQQEALRWLDSEAQAQEGRKELWKAKFQEIENALRIGNSKTQIESRIKDFDRGLLDPEESAHLDSLLNKAQLIDQIKLDTKWDEYLKEKDLGLKESLKQTLIEKYEYLFSKEQRLSFASPEDRELNIEKECEVNRTNAAEFLIQSKTQIKRKREFLQKASGELKSCIDSLPEGEYKEKISSELRRIQRWM